MWQKPRSFDRNLVVIGAGSAGLVAALIAATVKARVTLIEKHRMGGDCLNTGCVPSKTLIKSAKIASLFKRAGEFGINNARYDIDFAAMMERVQAVIKKIEPHDSMDRFESLGVECIRGQAQIVSPSAVTVNDQTLTTRNIIIATGAHPFVPPIKGMENIDYLTSDNLWEIRTLPKRLIVLGGGPIGTELAQAFARLGSRVTQVEMLERIMSGEDEDIAGMVAQRLQKDGVDIRVGHTARAVVRKNNKKILVCERNDDQVEIEFDQLLVAVGRAANTDGLGLEKLGVRLNANNTVRVNACLQTSIPTIFACGDVAGPYQFTHTASHQAWYATVNALFGKFKKFKVDYSVIPWATFTDPEVARVGLNEKDARQQGIDYEVTKYPVADLDRAIAEGEDHGLVKVLTAPKKDRILGATIIGAHAGDWIGEYISAMRNNFGLNRILGTIHIYPTMAEANKFAAGVWKKAHAPARLLSLAEKYHRWMRH